MPNINARSLLNSNINTMNLLKDNTTLLAVFFNRFGENHVKSFIDPFLTEFSNKPKIQLEINCDKQKTFTTFSEL